MQWYKNNTPFPIQASGKTILPGAIEELESDSSGELTCIGEDTSTGIVKFADVPEGNFKDSVDIIEEVTIENG